MEKVGSDNVRSINDPASGEAGFIHVSEAR